MEHTSSSFHTALPYHFQWAVGWHMSLKLPLPVGNMDPHYGSMDPRVFPQTASQSVQPFCKTHGCDQHTDRPDRDHATPPAAISHIYAQYAVQAMWPNTIDVHNTAVSGCLPLIAEVIKCCLRSLDHTARIPSISQNNSLRTIKHRCTVAVYITTQLHLSNIMKPLKETIFTFRPRTRSMRYFPSGLMSFNTRAMMMSRPLLSWPAMAFCTEHNTQSNCSVTNELHKYTDNIVISIAIIC